MNILGINYFFHDSSACLVQDGKLTVALEEERFTRVKHTYSFPYKSIEKCLSVAKIGFKDIDFVAVSIKPDMHWIKKFSYILSAVHRSPSLLKHEVFSAYFKQRDLHQWFNRTWSDVKKPKLYFVPHHLSHAVGSFFVSPYEEAALLGIDGSGEWATTFMGEGRGNQFTRINENYFPHSLGSIYEAATEFCGFRPNYDEGKTMGLAPLGNPAVYFDKVSDIVKVDKKGNLEIDLSYFDYQYWSKNRCSQKFIETFGKKRQSGEAISENHADVAAAFQAVLEARILEMCDILYHATKMDYLVFAGGVALNSVANGRIIRETNFKDIYVMPAAGDNGTSIGAAYYLYNGLLDKPRRYLHMNPYVGNSYTNSEIEKTLEECKIQASFHEDICEVTANLLQEGKIIGWFQGNMEIGPRALGNRSILANPTLLNMKDKINAEVKHREAFRPFAPACVKEEKSKYFEIDVEAPFMLKVCKIKKDYLEVIPAVAHVDGTARLQTVDAGTNPIFYELLQKFGKQSGIPVLLNTSFNIMGEPIVESPIQAIRCFFSTGLDHLVLGNYLISK